MLICHNCHSLAIIGELGFVPGALASLQAVAPCHLHSESPSLVKYIRIGLFAGKMQDRMEWVPPRLVAYSAIAELLS